MLTVSRAKRGQVNFSEARHEQCARYDDFLPTVSRTRRGQTDFTDARLEKCVCVCACGIFILADRVVDK